MLIFLLIFLKLSFHVLQFRQGDLVLVLSVIGSSNFLHDDKGVVRGIIDDEIEGSLFNIENKA